MYENLLPDSSYACSHSVAWHSIAPESLGRRFDSSIGVPYGFEFFSRCFRLGLTIRIYITLVDYLPTHLNTLIYVYNKLYDQAPIYKSSENGEFRVSSATAVKHK